LKQLYFWKKKKTKMKNVIEIHTKGAKELQNFKNASERKRKSFRSLSTMKGLT